MPKPVQIVDIDVTIADGSHRLHLLKEYCARCGMQAKVAYVGHDQPSHNVCPNCDYTVFTTPTSSWVDFCNPYMLSLDTPVYGAQTFLAKTAQHCDTHYITGRHEDSREVTEKWLAEHFGFKAEKNKLLMRETSSFTERRGVNHLPASMHKQLCFEKLVKECGYTEKNLFLFFDDDLSVLDMYANYGLVFKAPDCWNSIWTNPYPNPSFIFAR